MREPDFAAVVANDVTSGVHLNPSRRPGWFARSYFHRAHELAEEVETAGLLADGPVAVEGLAWLAPDVDALLEDADLRIRVLGAIRRTEREPALLGASAHLLIAGHKPQPESQ